MELVLQSFGGTDAVGEGKEYQENCVGRELAAKCTGSGGKNLCTFAGVAAAQNRGLHWG